MNNKNRCIAIKLDDKNVKWSIEAGKIIKIWNTLSVDTMKTMIYNKYGNQYLGCAAHYYKRVLSNDSVKDIKAPEMSMWLELICDITNKNIKGEKKIHYDTKQKALYIISDVNDEQMLRKDVRTLVESVKDTLNTIGCIDGRFKIKEITPSVKNDFAYKLVKKRMRKLEKLESKVELTKELEQKIDYLKYRFEKLGEMQPTDREFHFAWLPLSGEISQMVETMKKMKKK